MKVIHKEAAINALYELCEDQSCDCFKQKNPHIDLVVETLEKLPTAEAIPFEWLQQKIYSLGVTCDAFNEMAASILSAFLDEYKKEISAEVNETNGRK